MDNKLQTFEKQAICINLLSIVICLQGTIRRLLLLSASNHYNEAGHIVGVTLLKKGMESRKTCLDVRQLGYFITRKCGPKRVGLLRGLINEEKILI